MAETDRGGNPALLFRRPVYPMRTTLVAAVLAGVAGVVPSILHTIATGGDWLESINAVATMVKAENLTMGWRVSVATAIHFAISLMWASVLIAILPRRQPLLWASAAGVVIAVIDLLVLAPIFFTEIGSLSFWPQLADHVVWGASVGAVRALTTKT
jgi:hypothetical protein